jgi:hypothetical protein
MRLKDAGVLQMVTRADVLANYEDPVGGAICPESHGAGRWTLPLAIVPQDLRTDQTMSRLVGASVRGVAGEAIQCGERPRPSRRRVAARREHRPAGRDYFRDGG